MRCIFISQKHKAAIEEEWGFEELKILREIVYTRIKREGSIIKVLSVVVMSTDQNVYFRIYTYLYPPQNGVFIPPNS